MKLFVTDYDDTLYINDDEIKETINDIIELQKRDTVFMIATGRSLPSIKKEILKHNIPFDYLSCADGSLIYDNNYKLIKGFHMNNVITKEIPNLVKYSNYDHMQYSYDEGYEDNLDLTKNLSSINIVIFEENFTKDFKKKWDNLKKKYPEYNFLEYKHLYSVTKTFLYYLCIKTKGVSKSKSIEFMADYLNIKKKDIFVIGDSDNDYEMINDFNGVTVINGSDKIKSVSKKIYNKISDYIKEI